MHLVIVSVHWWPDPLVVEYHLRICWPNAWAAVRDSSRRPNWNLMLALVRFVRLLVVTSHVAQSPPIATTYHYWCWDRPVWVRAAIQSDRIPSHRYRKRAFLLIASPRTIVSVSLVVHHASVPTWLCLRDCDELSPVVWKSMLSVESVALTKCRYERRGYTTEWNKNKRTKFFHQ